MEGLTFLRRHVPFIEGGALPTLRDPQYRAFARRELFRRQGGRCLYCEREFTEAGELAMTIEHLKPKMKGGKDGLKNLAAACWHCNQHRGKQMNATKMRKEAEAKVKAKASAVGAKKSVTSPLPTSPREGI
ncbi:HNH endonuclease signature motif containing protein [Mesorhizobium sp. M1E.F.Ca.ET.063.01.1.1]|uniref:HNH endonuclease n=1 Tax=Mesorhizobium sp. M1E.F.Ca.ET.063.01.1.1 TaxID=2496750 RepID=UPI000FC9D1CE|nr:HNH endonuclease signature motif containing protein [Mesorhizobium sp. M1E.F.Ca.ET.063.01.1.1]RUW85192.1 HNH endonuclease [Mesorhizobium sp. M1E.F.Ca.ET.063.01.1.1]